MEKRISQRKSGKYLAAAVASVGLAGFGAQQSDGGVVVDLRATYILNSPAYNSGTPFANPKQVNANIGDTVLMNVVVRISGTNASQQVGDFDAGGAANDTRNDDAFNSLVGAFQSVGAFKGNFIPAHGGQVAPWSSPGATNGLYQDFDTDGDLDLGALGTDPTNMWAARGDAPKATTLGITGGGMTPLGTRFGVSSGSAFTEDIGGQLAGKPPITDLILDPTTSEMLLGELVFVVTGGAGVTSVSFIPRSNGDAATALWFEDGITTGKNPSNSPFTQGAPVQIGVPEPTSLGLLGLASLGLLARRRDKKA